MPTVLVVEDNPLNLTLVRDILRMQFTVIEARSAEVAQDQLRQVRPDLILMDMQLPGMDGLTLVRLLKKDPRTASIPVIAVSAHAMEFNIEQALSAGCVDYITKPITDDPFTFLERVTRPLLPTTEAANPAGRVS
jgi:two-component system, cell cycle response regulator DivK